jgi:type IX secretion system PorP/SprF family membrane protein
MNYTKIFAYHLLFCLGFLSTQLVAQKQQFSQFHNSPMLVNPAFVASSNQMQVLMNYRREMLGGNMIFANPMLSFIRPFISSSQEEGEGKRWGGLGVHLLQDHTMGNSLQTISAGATYAHNLQLSENNFISFGVQLSYFQKSFNANSLQSEQSLLGQPVVDPLLTGGTRTKGVVSLHTGALWYQPGESGQHKYFFGVSAYHLNQPSFEFIESNESVKQPINFIVSGGLEVFRTEKWSVQPNFRWIMEGSSNLINLGTLGRYTLNADHMLGLGTWWSQRAVIVGLDYAFKNLFIGISYDIVTDQEVNRSATEVTIGYRKRLGSK